VRKDIFFDRHQDLCRDLFANERSRLCPIIDEFGPCTFGPFLFWGGDTLASPLITFHNLLLLCHYLKNKY